MKRVSAAERDALLGAIQSARFLIHCQMLGMRDEPEKRDPTGEGIEIAQEVALELCRAVLPFDPEQKACKGCGDRHTSLDGTARGAVEAYEKWLVDFKARRAA